MGKFNSKVEMPLGTDCVRLSRVHCTYISTNCTTYLPTNLPTSHSPTNLLT